MPIFSEVVNIVSATAAGVNNATAKTEKKLPESCQMIRRIKVDAIAVGTAAAAKPVLGYIRITSKDVDGIRPLHIPLEPQAAFLGTGGGTPAVEPRWWVVNRATKKGPTLEIDSVMDIAPNGAVELMVQIEYSTGEMVDNYPTNINYQIAKSLTTGPAGSTSDNGTDAGPDIDIKGAKQILDVFAYAATTALNADEAMALECEIESADFQYAGHHKMVVNGASVIDATNAVQPVHGGVSFLGHGVQLKDGIESPTVSATLTARDAQTTGPTWNWGIAYV